MENTEVLARLRLVANTVNLFSKKYKAEVKNVFFDMDGCEDMKHDTIVLTDINDASDHGFQIGDLEREKILETGHDGLLKVVEFLIGDNSYYNGNYFYKFLENI
jgi:hypothetical protein